MGWRGGSTGIRVLSSGSGTLAAGASVALPLTVNAAEVPAFDVAGYLSGTAVEVGFGLALEAIMSNPGVVSTGYVLTLRNNLAVGTIAYQYVLRGVAR